MQIDRLTATTLAPTSHKRGCPRNTTTKPTITFMSPDSARVTQKDTYLTTDTVNRRSRRHRRSWRDKLIQGHERNIFVRRWFCEARCIVTGRCFLRRRRGSSSVPPRRVLCLGNRLFRHTIEIDGFLLFLISCRYEKGKLGCFRGVGYMVLVER